MKVKDYIAEQIQMAIAGQLHLSSADIVLEIPRDKSHGDLATSIALKLAKDLKQKPKDIAESIIANLPDPKHFIMSAEIAGPGFINFRLSPAHLQDAIATIVQEDTDYGKTIKDEPERILLEFVSANPTGPMNIVSARAGAVGNTLVNLMRWAGHVVKSEYYVNDGGVQVDNLAKSVDVRYRELLGESVEQNEEMYHGDYVLDIARKIIDEAGSDYFLKDDETRLVYFKKIAISSMVASQKKDLTDFRVIYDRWFFESEIYTAGAIRTVIDRLLALGLIYDNDGCLWFKSTENGDDEDRVLIKSDGNPTYFLPDIAYHLNKYERGFDRVIDIWGPDHHGYIPRMTAAMEALGHPRDSFEVLICQQVNLLKEGVTLKMSKRAGVIVTLRELIAEVGVDVARYFFIRRKVSSHLDFDLDLAKKESDENPVYYVQYAHARICSILRHAEEGNVNMPGIEAIDLSLLIQTEELALMKVLLQFPDTICGAADAREPHRLPLYLESVAGAFHQFYHHQRVVTENIPLTHSRLALCRATLIVLRNGLNLLGVNPQQRM